MKNIHFIILALVAIIAACVKDIEPTVKSSISPNLPASAPEYYQNNPDSKINEKALLGRVLFYEKQLSHNNTVSCGTCHKQAFAFADNVAKSKGFQSQLTGRNTPPLQDFGFNLANSPGLPPGFVNNEFFWDGRQNDLRNLILKPVANHIEMGINDISIIPEKLSKLPYYKALFEKAYESEEITLENIADAMSFFILSMRTGSSKFDKLAKNEVTFNALENRGLELFHSKYNCSFCHIPSTNGYISIGFFNIGLEKNVSDRGRAAIDNNPLHEGAFKVPNLKNIALTAPYMHDGRFKTLDEVLDHYSNGIKYNEALSSNLKDSNDPNKPLRLNITKEDKQAIIAFLNTLTDYQFILDPKFSDPFENL